MRPLRLFFRALPLVFATAMVTVPTVGCGGATPSAEVAAASKKLTFFVVPAPDATAPADIVRETVDAMGVALANKGLVVLQEAGPTVDVRVAVFVAQTTPGMVHTYVGGKEVPRWRAVAVILDRENHIMARFSDDFTALRVDDGDVSGIAGEIAASPSLAVLAKKNADAASAALEADEEALWSQVSITRCEHAKAEKDCAPVRDYLKSFPNGTHAPQARALLQHSETPKK